MCSKWIKEKLVNGEGGLKFIENGSSLAELYVEFFKSSIHSFLRYAFQPSDIPL